MAGIKWQNNHSMTQFYRTSLVCFVLFLSVNLSAQFWDLRPSAICQSGVNVAVGSSCTAIITPEMIDGGSSSIVNPLSMSVSPSHLGLGTHTVQLSVSNAFGTRFCQSVVFVEDKQAPTAICEEYITVTIDDPTTLPSTITPSMIDAGSYDNCGVTVSWVDVAGLTYYGATTASLTVLDGAGNENTCWSTITVESPHYSGGVCAAYGNTYYEHIAYFSWTSPVEDFLVYSGDDDGHVFFTNERTIRAGDAVNISYAPGFSGGTYREYWRVFLDMNRDGDWDDTGEMLHQWNGVNGNSANINLPIVFGRYGISRMRVVMSYGGYKDPCDKNFYGEVEDYAVRLTSGWTFGFREDAEIQVNSSRLIAEEIADGTDEFGQTIPLTPPPALPSRNETPSAGGTTIYPNPASVGGTVDVALNMAGPLVQSVELNNLVGQPLRRYPATSSNRMSIQLPANLSPGVYLLSGISQNGREWTKKLLVR